MTLINAGFCGVVALQIATITGLAAAAASSASVKPAVKRVITVSEGTEMSVTAADDGNRLILSLQGKLWALSSRGGKAKRLTDEFLEPVRAEYSPAGDAVVFQAFKGGTFHIWTMNPDGRNLKQLTTGHGDDREPRWSPDGTRIAFSSDRAFKGSYDVWILDVATCKLTQLTDSPADEYEPAWLPDATEIAFVSGVGINGTTIEAKKLTGEQRTLITAPSGAHLNAPNFSPDGKKLSYTQFAEGKSELYISGEHVGSAQDVFPFPAVWLSGERLLYTADGKIQVTKLSTNETEIIPFQAQFAIDRPAYTRKNFDLEPATAKPVTGIVGPALSPDGKRIVFQALNQIWLMDIGGAPRQLTSDRYYKEDPAWSPDGKSIAFSSDEAGTEDIYILDLATGQERRVTTSSQSAEMAAAWSPDGKQLAFEDQTGSTHVLELQSGNERLVIPAQFEPGKPSWASSGDALSIAAVKPYTRRFREGTSQLLTVNLKTGKLTFSEPAPFGSISTRGEDGPVYSPDGKYVAFVMSSVLWVRSVDRDGLPAGEVRQITHEPTDAPTWSGDSQHILYLSNGKLRLADLQGSNTRTIPLNLTWTSISAEQPVLIHAGRLWDGRGPDVQSDVDLLISGKRIQSIHPHSAQPPSGVRVVDASNFTVLPGLWESHTHEWIAGKSYGDRLGRLWLAYGVTELQSQGDPVYRALETREAFASGTRVGPRYFATGEAIDGERVYYNFMRPTTSEAQLQIELARAKTLEYDNLKTYVRLPHEMQLEVSDFGHSQMGVVTASHYMMPGLAHGVDGMTHVSATSRLGIAETRTAGGVSYEDVRNLIAQSGEFVISTSFTSFPLYADDPEMVRDRRLQVLNTPWEQKTLDMKRELAEGKHPALPEGWHGLADVAVTLASLQKEESTVAAILHKGGIVLAGTDSPLDNVATALHLNLRAQVKYGLKPWEALQTATLLPAKAFGVSADLGTVEPGKLADLVIVSGDPLTNIKDLANVQQVVKSGRVYSVEELLAPFAGKQQ